VSEINASESALLDFFQSHKNVEFSHAELEYGVSAKSWFLDQGLEFPKNIGRTARGLVQKGYLSRKARGMFVYDPSVSQEDQILLQSRSRLESELRSLIRLCDRLVGTAADPQVASSNERAAVIEVMGKVVDLVRKAFPKVLD
jgi:hypothetical protein